MAKTYAKMFSIVPITLPFYSSPSQPGWYHLAPPNEAQDVMSLSLSLSPIDSVPPGPSGVCVSSSSSVASDDSDRTDVNASGPRHSARSSVRPSRRTCRITVQLTVQLGPLRSAHLFMKNHHHSCKNRPERAFSQGRPDYCPQCKEYVAVALDRHIMNNHLELGQLRRCCMERLRG